MYNTADTQVNKARFRTIDMHSHAYPENKLEIEAWVECMVKLGIEKTMVLTKAKGAKFDSLYALYSQWEDRFEVWCGFDYTGYDEPG